MSAQFIGSSLSCAASLTAAPDPEIKSKIQRPLRCSTFSFPAEAVRSLTRIITLRINFVQSPTKGITKFYKAAKKLLEKSKLVTFSAELRAVPQRINPLFVTFEVTVPKVCLKNETKNKVKN